MKNVILKALIIVGIIAMCCAGCAKSKSTESSNSGTGKVSLKDGILSWESNKKADYYEVKMGSRIITCEEAELELSELCKYEGENVITVYMVSDSQKKTEIGSLDIVMKALEKPAISIMETDDGETIFSWKAQKEAGGYGYDFNDGYGIQKVKIGDDQIARVTAPDSGQTMFKVIVEGTSKNNTYYIGTEVSYRYQGKVLFDLSHMANYPFYSVSNGESDEKLTVAVTLPKGNYDLDFTFAVMDIYGKSLTGNGRWGRHVTIQGTNNSYMWFCEEEVYNGASVRGGEDTLRPANERVTYTRNVNVNKYGEIYLTIQSFNVNEMLVITDIQYQGKSVMADRLVDRSGEKVAKVDVTKMNQYHAVFTSKGTGYKVAPQNDVFTVPVDLPNGAYEVEVAYQIMTKDGLQVSGNGLWGRRIGNAEMQGLVWYCEYAVGNNTKGMDLPLPTTMLKSTFQVKVKDGAFELICTNFNAGEMVAVSSVKKVSGSSARFDMSTLGNYKHVFVQEKVQSGATEWEVQTTLDKRGLYDVEISYYVADQEGYRCFGNGTWGRRVMAEGLSKIIWLCTTQVSNGTGTTGGENTLPEPNVLVTDSLTVTTNKNGVIKFNMYSFLQGEMFIIQDIKLNGESILEK